MLDCVTQCSQSAAHLYEQFLQVQQIGFVSPGAVGLDLDPTHKVFFFTDSGSPGGRN